MAKKKVKKKRSKVKLNTDSRFFAFLATFLSIVGFVIALLVKKDDKYVMYYAKQSLVVFVFFVLAFIAQAVLAFVPVLGIIVVPVISVIVFIIWIFSWVYALSGEMRETPLVGVYANNFNI